MSIKRVVIKAMGLLLMLGIVSAVAAVSPTAPTATPEVVVVQATDYTIQSPKLFYLYNPACAPILGPATSGNERAASPSQRNRAGDEVASSDGADGILAPVEQFVGRTAVHGASPRELYNYTFDEFCFPPDDPDIISDIVTDEEYVYWVSKQQEALVKVSEDRLNWETTPPDEIYSHTPQSSQLLLIGDNLYMLQATGGLHRVNKNTGAASPLLTGAQVGDFPNSFQTDGEYLYWRYRTGAGQWNLRAYDLDSGGTDVLAGGVISYYPVAGNVVYIGFNDVIRSYNHATGVLSSPLYTSDTPAEITSLAADGSGLYFIQRQVCDPACPGAYTLYRLTFGSSTPTPLYAPPTDPVQVMHDLQQHENSLFFLHNEELKRIPANAGMATLTNLGIDGLEITQAIQSDSNDVDLVRGKRTAVRLFASSDGDAIPGMYARLYRIDGSGSVIDGPLSPINLERASTYLRVPASPDRDNINESFTFFLPSTWVDDATLRLRAELNPFRFPPEPTYGDNVLNTETFDFDPSGRLEAHFILFEYDSGGSRVTPRYTEDYLQTVSWVRRTYPVASAPGSYLDSSPGFRPKVSWLFDPDLGGNVDGTDRDPHCECRRDNPSLDRATCQDVLGDDFDAQYKEGIDADLCAAWYVVCPQLDTIRAAEELPSEIQLVGMVSDEGGFPRGWACAGGVSTPTGDPADVPNFSWDNDGSYGDWYAGHEIGHSQGRAHPSSGNDCGHSASDSGYPWPDAEIGDNSYRGFDMGDPGLNSSLTPRVYPNEWHDMMSYCDNLWISDYTYLGIKSRLESSMTAPVQQAAAAGEFLQLSGLIFPESNGAELRQVRLWSSLAQTPAAPEPGPYRIRLLDDGDAELAAYDFTPVEGEDDNTLMMGEFVPFATGTSRVEIVHPASADLLWEYEISSAAPQVTDVELVGASSPVSGDVTLQWNATDADGDRLTYDLLYSRDDGVSWKVLQMGLTEMSAVIDTAVLGGSTQARFKVIGNDGLNQGEGMTAAFTMEDKAPVINVISPHDGEQFAFGQEVYFAAEVLDYQDGSVSSIQWRDQTGFLLGLGSEFSQDNLLIGENIVTVTAENSAGLAMQETFSIFVNDELAQPPATLTVGPDQIGWHVGEGETAVQTADVSVSNSGDGSFSVSVTEDVPWLSVSQSGNDTPLQITLNGDPSYLESGQSLATTLQVVGATGDGNQTVMVPVTFSMGNTFGPAPEASSHSLYLPLTISP